MLDPDSLEAELVETVRRSKGYGSFNPDEKQLRKMLDKVRGYLPDRDHLTEVLASWTERASKKRTPEYSDPVLALGKWFGLREADWRRIVRNRQIDEERAAKTSPQFVPSKYAGMSPEERLAARRREQDGAA